MSHNQAQALTKAPDGVAHGMRRARWLTLLLQWHWVSSALCLTGMLLFSVTGFTLNHASQIESKPTVKSYKAVAPAAVVAELRQFAAAHDGAKLAVPAQVAQWINQALPAGLADQPGEWSPDELYVPLPRPGGDAWLRIGLQDGAAEYELTDRGWISWLNDMHKGRNAGKAWSWFIDLFAIACVVFTLTGFLILKMHAQHRPMVWPLLGMSLLLPVLIALLFIH